MMKSFFKKLAFVMALAMVVTLAAPAAKTAVAAEKALAIGYQGGAAITALNLKNIGDEEDLCFYYAPANYKELGVNWSSSNPNVVDVDDNGVVVAKADGTATVSCAVGAKAASIDVYVGTEIKEFEATIGSQDGTERSMSKHTMKVGDEFDFRFFGIYDYDVTRYECKWLSLTPDVADVDDSGLVTAKAPGTAAITLSVSNQVVGKTYVVAPVVITVEAEEVEVTPAAEPSIDIVGTSKGRYNKTEVSFELDFKNFTNIDTAKLAKVENKNQIEVYAKHYDEVTKVTQLNAWQIYKINAVDEDTIEVIGYTTDELVDGQEYMVRYVVPAQDEADVKDIVDPIYFTASVGAAVDMELTHKSYKNNQGGWAYVNEGAYTTLGYGEEIETKVWYTVYDKNGVDVTGHFQRLASYDAGESLITFELVNEDAYNCFVLNEETDTFEFDDIPVGGAAIFNVVYNDYNVGELEEELVLTVKEPAPYYIKSIDDWQINIKEGSSVNNNWGALKQTIALYDDYNVDTMEPLENHEIILWFTDMFGNRFVTFDTEKNGDFKKRRVDGVTTYYYIGDDSEKANAEKFLTEGYQIYMESYNEQVMVVGDEFYYDVTTAKENVITTKKTGTATVNVTLRNADDSINSRVGNLTVKVLPYRYLASVDATNVSLTTDSIADNAVRSRVEHDNRNNLGDSDEYDTKWTKDSVKFSLKDNHGDKFGIYNETLLAKAEIAYEATNVDTTVFNGTLGVDKLNRADWNYPVAFDGVEVLEVLGFDETIRNVSFNAVATDAANEKEKMDTFRIVLNHPTHFVGTDVEVTGLKDEGDNWILRPTQTVNDIKTKNKFNIVVNGGSDSISYTSVKKDIEIIELSTNGYNVNYADNKDDSPITLWTNTASRSALFASNATETAKVGDYYVIVLDPQGRPVVLAEDAGEDKIGLIMNESGHYSFQVADTKNGALGARFAEAGSYTINLYEITEVKSGDDKLSQVGDTGKVSKYVTTTKKFRVVDDRANILYKDQTEVYVDGAWLDNEDPTMNQIAGEAFLYQYADGKAFPTDAEDVGGVRFNINSRANSVVLKDVFLKIWCGNNTWFYYVEVEMPNGKTVNLDHISTISDSTSVEYRKDPDGRKVQ